MIDYRNPAVEGNGHNGESGTGEQPLPLEWPGRKLRLDGQDDAASVLTTCPTQSGRRR